MFDELKLRPRRSLTAALLAGFCLAGAIAHADPQPHPVLAVDPLPAGAETENHSAVISRWFSRGYAGAVLLHIDARSRTRPLGVEQAAAIAKFRTMRAAGPTAPAVPDATAGRPLFETSFVRAVVILGIAREAYWVIPFDRSLGPEAEQSLRADLKQSGIVEEELRTFALRDGCFRGTVEGAPFAVCSLEELPRIAAPVLLSLDTDFVMAAAAGVSNPIAEMRKLLAALAARRYAVLDSVVCTSVEPEQVSLVSPDLRWVGETIALALREPSLLTRAEQPKRWALLQTLALLESVGDYQEMLHQALPYLTVREEDPALHLYAANALAGRGKTEGALEHAEEACRLQRGYCYGLPWIGLRLFAAGDIEGGERYFAAGAKLRPGMLFGQLPRGLLLQQAGRPEAALRAYLALSESGDVLPAAFLAGALQLRMGDRQAARRQFDRALEALPSAAAAEVIDPDTAHAIREAARLYREEGLTRQAESLENNPRLYISQEEDPPVTP